MIRIFWLFRALLYRVYFKKIGKFSYIGKPSFIYGSRRIELGRNVHIFPGVRLESHGKKSKISIMDNVAIGQNVHITATQSELVIGKNTTILGNTFITNMDHDYQEIGKHIRNQQIIYRHTKIGDNCFIGFGASIQAGTVLGNQCIVGTNAVVRGEFPDYCVIAGIPAKIIKQYNKKNKKWEKV